VIVKTKQMVLDTFLNYKQSVQNLSKFGFNHYFETKLGGVIFCLLWIEPNVIKKLAYHVKLPIVNLLANSSIALFVYVPKLFYLLWSYLNEIYLASLLNKHCSG